MSSSPPPGRPFLRSRHLEFAVIGIFLVLLIVFFVLGIAAGIRTMMRAAREINAELAKARSDKETGS